MKTSLIPIDSEVLGAPVLSIDDFSSQEDFAEFERAYVARHSPYYVTCKVPLERLADIHALEDHGFKLIECQIRAKIDLRKEVDTSGFAYRFARVESEADLADVLEIAGTTFTADRFSVDPLIPPGTSGARYRRYVQQSFAAPNEAVYRLYDPATNRAVAFKSHRYVSDTEVLLLLGGVHPDFVGSGVGVMNTYSELAELRRRGVTTGHTHISAGNHGIFNLEIGTLGYRVAATFAVMRKIYDQRKT